MIQKKIFFISDFHLGSPCYNESLIREKKIVQFLSSIENEASEIFLLGDLFDFWYEYKTVVPKGFVRLLGQLAAMSDKGIKLHLLIGNHDMWMKNYFQTEINCDVYFKEIIVEREGKKFFIAHGDGLGPGDLRYKFLKSIFRNPICQWLFGKLPPVWGLGLGNFFSGRSRLTNLKTYSPNEQIDVENESQFKFCLAEYEKNKIDFFVMGHRHLMIDYNYKNLFHFINTGDWINFNSYAVFDGENVKLLQYQN